jgi:hypothetical protein
MAISIRKYVEIISGVGGGVGVRQRELVGRLFSEDTKTPGGAVVEFSDADSVGVYYGFASPEYLRAVFYFSFVSKSITAPKKLGFVRFARTAQPARIFGAKVTAALAAFNAVTAGSFVLHIGAQTATLAGLDLSGAGSLTAVAAALQTAIRAAAGAQFTTALVAYDAPSQTFRLTGSTNGDADISVTTGGAGDVSALFGFRPPSAIFAPGMNAQTVTEALAAAAAGDNNFGSFAFIGALTEDETVEAAEWNGARNVEFLFCARVTAASAATLYAALVSVPGTAMTLAPVATEYDELAPMIILAATDYTRRAATQNFMFQQLPGLTAKVSTTDASDEYDAYRVNYYGNTQTAGQQINFYQRGVMTGPANSPVDLNTYANEMWLKDRAASALMSLLLSLPRIPANVEGRGQILAILQDSIDAALFNGTISVGRTLTAVQRLYVSTLTGDPDAWRQVEAIGYWVDAAIQSYETVDGRTEYKAVYTLVYAKDDAVRKVEGSHALV